MTNKTICHGNNVNNKSQSKSSHSFLSSSANKAVGVAAAAAAASSTQSFSSSSSLSNGKSNNTSNTSQINNNNSNNIQSYVGGGCANDVGSDGGGGRLIKAYAHGIWYQEYDTIDNSVQQHIQLLQQQRQRCYNSNVRTVIKSNGEDASRNVLRPASGEMETSRQQQRPHKGIKDYNESNSSSSNNKKDASNPNNCDIVVVDIEDEKLYEGKSTPPPQPPTNRTSSSQYPINAAVRQADRHTLLAETISNRQDSSIGHVVVTRYDNIASHGRYDDDDEDNNDDDDNDSLASMETLSDNVSIWIDGEKHWIAGVDAQTTCADLVWALLNYQNGQPEHTLNANAAQAGGNDGQVDGHYTEQYKEQQQQPCRWANKDNQTQSVINSNKVSGNASTSSHTSHTTSTGNINQSMPKNTKEEHFKITENSSRITPLLPVQATTTGAGCNATTGLTCAPLAAFPLPPGITTAAQLATEYVIVKQYHHCEEYLDGSTKVFDVLPPRNSQHKKECELLLRRLGPAPMSVYANNTAATTTTTTPQLSSLISTDKDSGMGSPVGSARSAKFRRRKHKSSQWLAQANTLHPKLSRCTATANERLLKIILAQDETIQRQLSLLREKERQINKIEEEKHRKRERELGKNYLLETYLNGLDEAECEPEPPDGEEIFIDELPYPQHATNCDSGATNTNNKMLMTSQIDTLSMEMIMLDNFKPKEAKKDKKKKRHKEKSTTKDEINANKAKDKEQKLLRLYGNETSNIPGSIVNHNETNDDDADGGGVDKANKAEMEIQIYWWEKVYTLNKQLQKEEELAAKLHAKIRKHQLKKANQTQKEVQLEIDKLDNGLALQCGNIRRVEANLMETNDQLQKKLLILERLSLEYLRQQDGEQAEEGKQNRANELRAPNAQPTLAAHLSEKSVEEIHKLSLSNIKSASEVEQLQKLIAKPGFDEQCRESQEQVTTSTEIKTNDAFNEANADDVDPSATALTRQAFASVQHTLGERQLNPASVANNERLPVLNSTNGKTPYTTAPIKTSHDVQQPLVTLRATPTPPLPLISSTLSSASTAKTISQVSVLLDKNMLSSLHVQNAKTIKKQMFHSQTTSTGSATATPPPTAASPITITSIATAATSTAANAKLPKATEINAFPPKQQQQQCQHFNQAPPLQQRQLTMSSSTASPTTMQPSALISSRPTHSHHQPLSSCSVLAARQPAVSAVAAAASLAPIQATMAAMTLPASSSSSPSSLMAMNTVDISQLGTLV